MKDITKLWTEWKNGELNPNPVQEQILILWEAYLGADIPSNKDFALLVIKAPKFLTELYHNSSAIISGTTPGK